MREKDSKETLLDVFGEIALATANATKDIDVMSASKGIHSEENVLAVEHYVNKITDELGWLHTWVAMRRESSNEN